MQMELVVEMKLLKKVFVKVSWHTSEEEQRRTMEYLLGDRLYNV